MLPPPPTLEVYFKIAVALLTILGAAKTAYDGALRDAYVKLKLYDNLPDVLDSIQERQEVIVDTLVVLTRASANDSAEVRPEIIEDRLGRGDDLDRYLRESDESDESDDSETITDALRGSDED